MSILEISIICLLSILQSIFGVGILLLGTPTFILMGYSYFEVLNILLPYSIIISFVQIIVSNDKKIFFFNKIFLYSLPTLVLGLVAASYFENKFNYKYLIGSFLIFTSIINIFKFNLGKKLFKNLNINLIFLGFIHGISNLGGGILSVIASNISEKKNEIRFYIASGYFIFATIQLLIVNIFYQKIDYSNIIYIWIALIVFYFSNKIFNSIDNKNFFLLISIFIFIYGVILFFY